MSDLLIQADGVSKKFCRSLKRSLYYGVRDSVSDLFGRDREDEQLRHDEFWAVDDVSFQVRRGDCLGLIGHNGAGKTTLLKMLNGLIKPDRGKIQIRGRVAALIALGAGFNPILSGRENVYINGSVLGLSKKEIDRRFDEIVDFAEVGEFIDSPVQSYSSGMQVRLGFSVATALEPDVLLLDEVLAVGDARFRQKSLNRVTKLLDRAAVIFVSHSTWTIARYCTNAILMQKGKIVSRGESGETVLAYLDQNFVSSEPAVELGSKLLGPVEVNGDFGERHRVNEDSAMRIAIGLEIGDLDEDFVVWFRFRTPEGDFAGGCKTHVSRADVDTIARIEAFIPVVILVPGPYYIDVVVCSDDLRRPYTVVEHATRVDVVGSRYLARGDRVNIPTLWTIDGHAVQAHGDRALTDLASNGAPQSLDAIQPQSTLQIPMGHDLK